MMWCIFKCINLIETATLNCRNQRIRGSPKFSFEIWSWMEPDPIGIWYFHRVPVNPADVFIEPTVLEIISKLFPIRKICSTSANDQKTIANIELRLCSQKRCTPKRTRHASVNSMRSRGTTFQNCFWVTVPNVIKIMQGCI